MRLAVVGANGHMGQELIKAVDRNQKAELTAAFVRQGSPLVGQKVTSLTTIANPNLLLSDNFEDMAGQIDGILDFTLPEASVQYAEFAAQKGLVHIIGTTGFTDTQNKQIHDAARYATIVKSGNMSLGVNLLANLVERAARALSAEDFDIEIVEMHHRRKVDAPSGTALLLGEAAAKGRNINLNNARVSGRDGHTGARETGTIGFAALRGGTVIGDHSVILAGDNERIVLSHMAQDRSIFANGAVKAALWAQKKDKGLYSMFDVLGLND